MEISFDSPEAFEEVVWLTHMADKIVQGKALATLSADDIAEEFGDAVKDSVRKVLALAKQVEPGSRQLRYLSKNNANISRMDALLKLFPTSSILVLFRNPLAHISSLAKQHERFLQKHASDTFSKQYMRWIGHYDFGENFKPIDFDGWLSDTELPLRVDETLWLQYWNAAYSYALKHKTTNVYFVDFDRLLEDRAASLERIARPLSLENEKTLIDAARTLRSPTTQPVNMTTCPQDDWSRAQDIYSQLKPLAV